MNEDAINCFLVVVFGAVAILVVSMATSCEAGRHSVDCVREGGEWLDGACKGKSK